MDLELRDKFSSLMYAFTKNAARDSFMEFLEYNDVTHEEWQKIKEHLKKTYGVDTYV